MEEVNKESLVIDNFDMGDHTLYFGDVLKLIVEKFNIKQISRAKICFRSLSELEEFPVPIDTSTIYVFDKRSYLNIDLSQIKLTGYSSINFNTSPEVYDKYRNFDDKFYFTSIMNHGDELFREIIGNSAFKKIKFYTPQILRKLDNQSQITLKIPETLEF